MRDHPRVCGEKDLKFAISGNNLGSPPRMRGKAYALGTNPDALRITPAYAGKSVFDVVIYALHEDHPRVCGEKYQNNEGVKQSQGSPPRMRGKD